MISVLIPQVVMYSVLENQTRLLLLRMDFLMLQRMDIIPLLLSQMME